MPRPPALATWPANGVGLGAVGAADGVPPGAPGAGAAGAGCDVAAAGVAAAAAGGAACAGACVGGGAGVDGGAGVLVGAGTGVGVGARVAEAGRVGGTSVGGGLGDTLLARATGLTVGVPSTLMLTVCDRLRTKKPIAARTINRPMIRAIHGQRLEGSRCSTGAVGGGMLAIGHCPPRHIPCPCVSLRHDQCLRRSPARA
ncbi:MAG: hypothetical protein E6I52_04085 [Chloroflexi bacterium]|nr:MAG: hypothetical protein E6I52_04085 [Chloroflexota bacterium]